MGAVYLALSNPIAMAHVGALQAPPTPKPITNPLLVKVPDIAPIQPTTLAEQPGVVYVPPVPVYVVPVYAPGDAKQYALGLVGSSQFSCLDSLWTKESNWNPYAVNSIGAMGIPQALGHGDVFALGDWKAQVDWGLNYISAAYGSACNAWAHSVAYNWY